MYVGTFHIGQLFSDAVCCLLRISSGGLGIGRDVVGLWSVGALCSFVLDQVCFHRIFLFRRLCGSEFRHLTPLIVRLPYFPSFM